MCRQTTCQDQRETDEDDSEYDEMLIEYAGDVVPSLGRALTTDRFIQVFMDLYPQLLLKTVSVAAGAACSAFHCLWRGLIMI